MSNGMMFGETVTNDVNVSTQGGKRANRIMDNIASQPTGPNIAEVAMGAAKAADSYFQLSNAIDADEAKRDFNNITRSQGYMEASSPQRAEMMEEVYNSMGDRSTAYQDAFTEYSADTYTKEYAERHEIEKNALYSKLPALQKAWNKANPTGTPEQYLDAVSAEYPYLDKAVVNTSLVAGVYEQSAQYINMAATPFQLQTAIEHIQEIKKPYNNPRFLQTKSKKGMTEIASMEQTIQTMIKSKNKEFKAYAKQDIITTNNTASPYEDQKYFRPPDFNQYKTAYGDEADGKYQTDLNHFNKHQEARDRYATFDASTTNDWSQENDVTVKLYQQALTDDIIDNIGINNEEAADMITNQGQVDTKRLDGVVEHFNSGLNSKEGAAVYSKLMRLKAESPAAFNSLYPDREDRAKILALGPLAQTIQGDFSEVYKYIQGAPEVTPEKVTVTGKNQINSRIHDKDIPVDLRKDIDVMYNTMGKYGIPHAQRIKAIDDYIDSKPYEVSFKGASSDAEDLYEWTLPGLVPEGSSTYMEPNTGMIYAQNDFGMVQPVMTKKDFKTYASKMSNIQAYNKDHAVSKGFESFADYLTSKVGQVSKYKIQGGRYSQERVEVDLSSQDPMLNLVNILTNDINLGTGKITKPKGGK